MGKCLFMRKGETHTEPVTYIGDPVFANNDWATIIEAIQQNKVHPTWEIGDSKTVTINGTEYAIDIIGKNHDSYSDGSGKAPLTFQTHDCVGEDQMNYSNTNSGGWTDCVMRNSILPFFLTKMPSEVQSGIKEVNKLTSAGNQSSNIVTTKDKLFLLSEIEIFNSVGNSYSGEGTQYDYYAAGNSRIKKLNGTAWHYWGRSPYKNASQFFRAQDTGGAYRYNASAELGVAFAFCF